MGFPLVLAVRYLRSKKQSFVSIGTVFAMLGVTLGVAALTIVMSVTRGFQEQFREKVLGVNAHVLVMSYASDFREYRDVMAKAQTVKGVVGVAPFVISPMMVTRGPRTATGVLVKGIDPERVGRVLDLPKNMVEGSMAGLRRIGAKPPERAFPTSLVTFGAKGLKPLTAQDLARDPGLPPPAEAPTPVLPAGSPIGDVTPTGGFASQLPDIDVLPDAVDPDPCRSADETAKLPGIIMGRALGKQLDVAIGGCVQVTSPTVGITFGANARPPMAKQFRVIAFFEAGFDQYDSKLVYTDLFEAQSFYGSGDSVTGVEMSVDDIDGAKRIAHDVEGVLGSTVYYSIDWQKLNHGLFTALEIQRYGMTMVLFLMTFVASFTVVATIIMMVLDKRKEISLLKAIGAHDSAILRVFLYQGAIIGGAGTLVGLLVGYFGCTGLAAYAFPLDPKVYFISKLPVATNPWDFFVAGGGAMAFCVIASIFPALHAARLRPSDGLRAE